MAGRRPSLKEARLATLLALADRVALNPPATPRQAAWAGYALVGIALSDDPEALGAAERVALKGN